jgi:beta-lactamase regulating signal transducer with metallopeptidase domain
MILMILNHLWQSTLCLGAAGALTLLLRENAAAARYRIWLAASVKFLLPFAALVGLGHELVPVRVTTLQSVVPPAAFLVQQVAAPFTAGAQPLQAVTVRWPSAGELAAMAWGLGMLLVAGTWWVRWHRLRRLVCEARPLAFEAAVPVRMTTASLEPGLVGILRPVLLVPERLVDRLTRQELDSIVTHELAHFRRRDNLTFAVHMLSEIVFWFYPPVWWLGRRLLLERERACDEAVLTAGHDAQVYGESILKVCRFHLPAAHGWSAAAAGSDLRTRMAAILSAAPIARVTTAKRALLVTTLAAVVVVPLLVGMVSTSTANAQNASSDSAITPQQIEQNRYEQARPRTAIPFKPADFDKFVGYYMLPGSYTVIHIYRQDDHFLLQANLSPAGVDIYPDSPTEFFLKLTPAQVSFNVAPGGQVTGLVMHQGGLLQPLGRISARRAQEVQAELQERIKQGKPSPGTEAAARQLIETQEAGQVDYQKMAPNLAALARLQQPLMQRMFQTLGPLKSLKFKRVAPSGLDIYDATFTHGDMQVMIGPLTSDGKVRAFAITRPQI